MRRFFRSNRYRIILGILLLVLAAVWILPVLMSTLSSFKTE